MRVPRVSKEIAQLIIIKLKKNIAKVKLDGEPDLGQSGTPNTEVIKILVNLGASEFEAERAVENAQKILGDSAQRDNLVKQALRYIRN